MSNVNCFPGGEGGVSEGNDGRGINRWRGALIRKGQGLSLPSLLRRQLPRWGAIYKKF